MFQGAGRRADMMGEADTRLDGDRAPETLWVLRREDHTVRCVASGQPGHEELTVLMDSELYFTEVHTVHDGLVGRSRTLRRGFEAHGWTLS